MHIWVIVRLALVATFFFLNFRSGVRPADEIHAAPFPVILVFGFIAVPILLSIRRIRPGRPLWSWPGWRRNPFDLRQPLQFFHFGGFFLMAIGAGLAAHALRAGSDVPAMALTWLGFGAGVLGGVSVSPYIYRGRMAER